MAHSLMVCTIDVHQLAAIVRNRIDNALILDSRSFLEYNASHVVNAVNVGCAKLMKRRLQQEKLCIEDFLAQNCHWEVDKSINIIVYDQSTRDAKYLSPDSFMAVFLQKLLSVYNSVNLLKGGFLEFQAAYPHLCEDERAKLGPLTSLSQPCLPVSNHGPTRILPFLYLGSQNDALNREVLQHHNITYQLNVSTSCPKPDFIQESHFMRIPVIDNYSEKLLPHFPKAFQFLEKVKESGGCVLVHCLAGISRSATVAISYVMKSLKMTSDEAYRYVKAKRATISPNFNFLGQLLEYEKQLQREFVLGLKSESSSAPLFSTSSLSYEQRHFHDSSENGRFSQKLIPDSYCVKYADVAETKTLSGSSTHFEATKTSECFISCEQRSVTAKLESYTIPEKSNGASSLSIKCLPVTSLRELSFTPCQTSSFKSTAKSEKCYSSSRKISTSPSKTSFLGSRGSDKKTECNAFTDVRFVDCKNSSVKSPDRVSPADSKSFEFDSRSYNRSDSGNTFDPRSFNRSDSGNTFDPRSYSRSDSGNTFDPRSFNRSDSGNTFDPRSFNRSDSVNTFDSKSFNGSDSASAFDSKSYNRSDSVSTSGLGSDGSEYADSWNEFTSSCERETDILMDDDYPVVPSGDDDMRRNKMAVFGDSYDESLSLYPKYEPTFDPCRMQQHRDYMQAAADAKKHIWKYEDPFKPHASPIVEDPGKNHLLYRAQSCPGMLSSEPNSQSGVKLRKSPSKTTKSSKDNYRNRYSCSSIDYMDYSQEAQRSSKGADKYSASHCSYRHSMIQVS